MSIKVFFVLFSINNIFFIFFFILILILILFNFNSNFIFIFIFIFISFIYLSIYLLSLFFFFVRNFQLLGLCNTCFFLLTFWIYSTMRDSFSLPSFSSGSTCSIISSCINIGNILWIVVTVLLLNASLSS